MPERILSGEVAISAVDRTGRVFENIERRTRGLRQNMTRLDGVIGRGLPASLARLDTTVKRMGAAFAGTYAFAQVEQAVGRVLNIYKDYDSIVRYQRAITGMSEAQQAPFIQQAITLGGATPYNDIRVLQAQLDLMQRGVNRDFIRPITEMAADYAQAMNADLPEAAKTIEGILFSTRKHIEDGNQALAVAHHTVDFAVKLSKIGGLDNQDITELFKYAGFAGSMAGLSDETIGTMAAMMRRSNIHGDESGVAIRALAGALVSPTQKGRAALLSMGIDWSKFAKMPDALSVGRLDMLMRSQFGKTILASMRGPLAAALANPELLGDQATFVSTVSRILAPAFAKAGPQGAKAISKEVANFYKLAVQNVDSEGLLKAIIEAHPTLALLNAFVGQKQGARVAAALSDDKLFADFHAKLAATPEGFAHQIAEERMAGASGAMQRAAGSAMNLATALGRANDSLITGGFNAVAEFLQAMAQADPIWLKIGTEAAMTATALIGLRAAAVAAALAMRLGAAAQAPGGRLLSLGTAVPVVGGALAMTQILRDQEARHQSGLPVDRSVIAGMPWYRRGAIWIQENVFGADPNLLVPELRARLPQSAGSAAAKIEGDATLNVNVKIDHDLQTTIETHLENAIPGLRIRGSTGDRGQGWADLYFK